MVAGQIGPCGPRGRALIIAARISAEIETCATECDRRRFLRLYLCSTRHWLTHLAHKDDADFAYLLIERFFALYRIHVAEKRAHDRTAPHWQAFVAGLARTGDGSRWTKARMLYLAVRAHVRFDLAQAIADAWQDYQHLHRREPDPHQIRRLLVGPEADHPFAMAAADFVHGGVGHRIPAAALTNGTRRIWLRTLQTWRRAAFAEAMAALGVTEADTLPLGTDCGDAYAGGAPRGAVFITTRP